MSTPSGKPFGQARISDYAPKRVRERFAASGEREQREEPDPPSANPTDPVEHSFATQPGDDGECLSPAPEALDPRSDTRLRTAFKDRIAAYDGDLQRLETALSAARLPPAPQLPRVQGLRSPDDLPIEHFRSSRSLEPAYVPPPPNREGRRVLTTVLLSVFAACAVAAPTAYFARNYYGPANQPLTATRGPEASAIDTQIAALPPMPATEPKVTPPLPAVQVTKQSPAQPPQEPANRYRLQSVEPAAPAPRETGSVATAWENPPASAAYSPAPSPAPSASPAHRPVPTIDRDDIAMLLKQGEQFVSVGDVAAARVLFERAAEAGDGTAALALGATYDPGVLAKLGVRGIAPDAEKAHHWYQKAREFGSPEAPTWLAKLAGR
jgi:hypothetical protein